MMTRYMEKNNPHHLIGAIVCVVVVFGIVLVSSFCKPTKEIAEETDNTQGGHEDIDKGLSKEQFNASRDTDSDASREFMKVGENKDYIQTDMAVTPADNQDKKEVILVDDRQETSEPVSNGEQTLDAENHSDTFNTEQEVEDGAQKEAEAYRQAYIASLGRNIVLADSNLNTYPYAENCPGIHWRYNGNIAGAAYGGLYCECTSYAGYKTYEHWGVQIAGWSDGKYWGSVAKSRGYTVDDHPAPYTIGYSSHGAWGHVVWVEAVNFDGTIDYSEYNGHVVADFSYVKGATASQFRYIHFD